MKKRAIMLTFVAFLLMFSACNQDSANQQILRDLNANPKQYFGKVMNALKSTAEMNINGKFFAEPIPQIIELLGSENAKIRLAAFETLKTYGEIIIPDLALFLDSDNDYIKLGALELLISIGKPALPAMKSLLKTGDDFTKISVIEVLGSIGDKSVIVDLAKNFDTKNDNLMIASAKALGKLKASQVSGKLIELLKSDNYLLRIAAVQSLQEIGDPSLADAIIDYIKPDDDSDYLLSALRTIRSIGKGRFKTTWAMRVLNPIFTYSEVDIRVRAEAGHLMKLCGYNRGIEALCADVLDGFYFDHPIFIAEILKVFKDVGKDATISKTMKRLVKVYKNDHIWVMAYGILYSYGETAYKANIIKLLGSKDLKAVELALNYCKEWKFIQACDSLPKLVTLPIFSVIFAALEAGSEIQCDSLIPYMESVFGSEEYAVELKEKVLIEVIKYPRDIAKPILEKAMNDADPYIAYFAEIQFLGMGN